MYKTTAKRRFCNVTLCLCWLLLAAKIGNSQDAAGDTYAQKLLEKTFAAHPELNVMGLHATSPSGGDSAIIASNVKSKIGKKSDPDDIEVMKTGKPVVEEKAARSIFDIGLPLLDSSGATIGTVVMEIKFSYTKSKSAALARAKQIRAELQKEIPSKEKLFEPAS